MAQYKIYPIRVGAFDKLEMSTLTLAKNQGVKVISPLIMYLITDGDKCLLVDTGGSDEAWSSKYHTRIVRPSDEAPEVSLKAHGVSPEDIHYVINTHLHWDHCFNNDIFPNASIYIQKKELSYARNPLPAHRGFYEAPSLGYLPKWMVAEDQIVPVEGDLELLPGIELVLLPGHTPGFQGVLVNTSDGRYMIAGDTVGLIDNFVGRTPNTRICSGIYCNLAESYNSLEKIAELADHVLPGHDAKVFEHQVYPPE